MNDLGGWTDGWRGFPRHRSGVAVLVIRGPNVDRMNSKCKQYIESLLTWLNGTCYTMGVWVAASRGPLLECKKDQIGHSSPNAMRRPSYPVECKTVPSVTIWQRQILRVAK